MLFIKSEPFIDDKTNENFLISTSNECNCSKYLYMFIFFSSLQALEFFVFPPSFPSSSFLRSPLMNSNECMEAADWLQVPDDLLSLVIEKFLISDHIRFASVCSQWRFFSNQSCSAQIKLPNQLPLLLTPSLFSTKPKEEEVDGDHSIIEEPTSPNSYILKEDRNYYNPKKTWQCEGKQRYRDTRSLYSLSEKRVYHEIQLPVPYFKNCRGSSYGWLITVEEDGDDDGNRSIRLLNPFRSVNNEIQLPHCEQGDIIKDTYFFVKAVISESPSVNPTGFVVMAIYDHFKLCFWKPGDKDWNSLTFPVGEWQFIEDVIYYKEQFYAINQEGLVVAIDIDDDPKVTVFAEPPKRTNTLPRKYLVESSGELLQVHRFHYRKEIYSTIGFKVFKLDRSSSKWVRMKSLDGCTLFLGDNASMSVSALDFPGCKPDCIYFTDDFYEGYSFNPPLGPHDMGVYSVLHETFEPYYALGPKIIMPPPIWIQPIL